MLPSQAAADCTPAVCSTTPTPGASPLRLACTAAGWCCQVRSPAACPACSPARADCSQSKPVQLCCCPLAFGRALRHDRTPAVCLASLWLVREIAQHASPCRAEAGWGEVAAEPGPLWRFLDDRRAHCLHGPAAGEPRCAREPVLAAVQPSCLCQASLEVLESGQSPLLLLLLLLLLLVSSGQVSVSSVCTAQSRHSAAGLARVTCQ